MYLVYVSVCVCVDVCLASGAVQCENVYSIRPCVPCVAYNEYTLTRYHI